MSRGGMSSRAVSLRALLDAVGIDLAAPSAAATGSGAADPVAAPACPEFEVRLSGVCDDSRVVQRGELYLALRGARADGRAYIAEAMARGAAAVLAEAGDGRLGIDTGNPGSAVPVIPVRGLRQLAGPLAAAFHGDPSRALRVCAVTGTNGKTTTSWLLAATLARLGERAAVLGTLGVGPIESRAPLRNTTPGAVELQGLLAGLRDAGFSAVAMEASSIGIEQHRLAGTRIDVALFTNLSRDHLDYHGTMAAYAEAKAALFSLPGLAGAVLNGDDSCALRWLAEGRVRAARILTCGQAGRGHDIELIGITAGSRGMKLQLAVEGTAFEADTRLVGQFNAGNLMSVIGALRLLGYETGAILAAIAEVGAPPGRMETFGGDSAPLCVVDYAHSPDALEKVLTVLRERARGALWCVFGCGGNRDVGKRPQMGTIAAALADHLVVTSDNPRDEDPGLIVAGVLAGLTGVERARVTVEIDRERAIAVAVASAANDDTVLVAGKGHEDYQEIAGQRLPFSDQAVVRQALAARGSAGGAA